MTGLRVLCFLLYSKFVLLSCEKNVIWLGYITGSEQKGLYYNKPGQIISGALTYALDQINNDSTILPNHYLDFKIAETYGSEKESIRRSVELLQYNISAYIGPQETCSHEGRIAASFNIPMISYVSY